MRILQQYRYSFASEAVFQRGIAEALTSNGIAFEREHVANAQSRFDFLCGSVVIEAKIGGSLSQALRQAHRYCEIEKVRSVVIVSTKAWVSKFGIVASVRAADVKKIYGVRLMRTGF